MRTARDPGPPRHARGLHGDVRHARCEGRDAAPARPGPRRSTACAGRAQGRAGRVAQLPAVRSGRPLRGSVDHGTHCPDRGDAGRRARVGARGAGPGPARRHRAHAGRCRGAGADTGDAAAAPGRLAGPGARVDIDIREVVDAEVQDGGRRGDRRRRLGDRRARRDRRGRTVADRRPAPHVRQGPGGDRSRGPRVRQARTARGAAAAGRGRVRTAGACPLAAALDRRRRLTGTPVGPRGVAPIGVGRGGGGCPGHEAAARAAHA